MKPNDHIRKQVLSIEMLMEGSYAGFADSNNHRTFKLSDKVTELISSHAILPMRNS